jgi:hypothetical protein
MMWSQLWVGVGHPGTSHCGCVRLYAAMDRRIFVSVLNGCVLPPMLVCIGMFHELVLVACSVHTHG